MEYIKNTQQIQNGVIKVEKKEKRSIATNRKQIGRYYI
jgi:hypothetical protein